MGGLPGLDGMGGMNSMNGMHMSPMFNPTPQGQGNSNGRNGNINRHLGHEQGIGGMPKGMYLSNGGGGGGGQQQGR